MNIRKAVFPVAGLGTRFLPATKASPKEMLPIVDKPIIQYAAEEAIQAGIKHLVFVTSWTKRAIADHFDKHFELEAELERKQKKELLDCVRNIVPSDVDCIYVRQPEALGLGHAVLCAEPVVDREPFAVILADDLIDSPRDGCLKQMVDQYNTTDSAIVAVETVADEDTDKYGIVDVKSTDSRLMEVSEIVEKPPLGTAPSNLGVVGRYVLPGKIFDLIRATGRGAGGEIQLTDAIASLMKTDSVFAWRFEGTRFDCGSKSGYFEATLNYAAKHPDIRETFKEQISKYL